MRMRKLKEVCEVVGITRRQLQGYESAGLIKYSSKNKMGHLLYDDEMFARICMIHEYKQIGFTLSEIKEIFDSSDIEKEDTMKNKLKELINERRELNKRIEKLKSFIGGGNK